MVRFLAFFFFGLEKKKIDSETYFAECLDVLAGGGGVAVAVSAGPAAGAGGGAAPAADPAAEEKKVRISLLF